MIEKPTELQFDIQTTRAPVPAPISDLVAGGVEVWTARTGDPVTFLSDRIEVAGGREFVTLIREVTWQSDGFDALQLAISNLNTSGRNLRVYWAGPGERFSDSRSSIAVETAPGVSVVTLVGHPKWSGRVSRIRIDIAAPGNGKTIVRSIQPMRFEYDLDEIASAVETNWKVDLDDDLRNAGLVAAQRPLVWNFDEPQRGFLEFSYGFLGASEGAVKLDVTARKRDGEWISVFESGHRRTPNESAAAWQEARIDLSPHGPVQAVKFGLVPVDASQLFAGLGVVANPAVSRPATKDSRANVLLISLDTLRADRLATFGYQKTTSPNIDSWATRSGVVFRNTVAPSPRTLPSHVSMLTGLDCLSHGVNHLSPAPPTLEMLAEILRHNEYATVGIVGGGLMNPSFGLGQGFDEFFHYAGWAGGFEELEVELANAFEKLERVKDRPFFMFFHTYEIHDPFHERTPFSDGCYSDFTRDSASDYVYGELARLRVAEDQHLLYYDLVKWKKGEHISSAVPVDADELELVNCLYDSGISYVDSQIDRLMGQLEDSGVLENTLVVVTSDHGESLGEKGLFKHAYLYENNLMVPLIFRFPGGQYGGQVFDQQVSTVDILPTVLEYLEIDVATELDGESLLPMIEGQVDVHRHEAWSYAAYENRGLSLRINNQIKYTYNNSAMSSAHGNEELFRLAGDPEELQNLAPEDPDTVHGLRDRLTSYYESRSTSTRVTIENRECEVVEGTIRTKGLMTQLKALDISSESLEPISQNQAKFRVLKNKLLKLYLESTDALDIRIAANSCGPERANSTVQRSSDLGDARTRIHLGLTNRGWQEFANEESLRRDVPAASVVIEALAGDTGKIPDVMTDDAILEQLRSLGYVQ